MKRIATIVIAVLMLCSASLAFASSTDFSFVDSMAYEDIVALRDYCQDIIDSNEAAPISTDEDVLELEATRKAPALVGDRVLVDYGDAVLAITIDNKLSGDSAKMMVKSFNRYNASSYSMGKGVEWVLLYLKIEAISSIEDRIDLSDYYFHMISDAGIDLGFSYIADNPLSVNAMYVDSTQYCWYGMCVPVGTKAFLTFEGGYNGDTYWFDLSQRRQVDTSAIEYPTLEKGATGEAVVAVQLMLAEYGFMPKVPFGTMDSSTAAALKKFQKAAGLATTGIADQDTQRALFAGVPLK